MRLWRGDLEGRGGKERRDRGIGKRKTVANKKGGIEIIVKGEKEIENEECNKREEERLED